MDMLDEEKEDEEKLEEKVEEEEEEEKEKRWHNIFFLFIPCSLFKGYFFWYLPSQTPPARKPLPRVRKPNLHSDRGQDSNPYAWRPIARMVPLYHGGPL
ncbi:hypothetical protein E2C01_071106 [Portunus trituberculatus]|uniref:Uncharacterized protein n=1 Tax=Portunus trituberculatus TaxID=210409 RepID=A0A5B7HZ53_PORTR|nr:hypothetical protein [Portunus trituberculatus]